VLYFPDSASPLRILIFKMTSTPKKRKLEDYFLSSSTSSKKCLTSSSPRHEDLGRLIPGLSIIHEFATQEEETRILSFLDAQTWRDDLARRVIHYGGSYCLMPPRDASPVERRKIESNIIPADPLPSSLDLLLDRMIQHQVYASSARPAYCIVNEYRESQGISAHVENFRFKSPVCGLTLCNGDYIRFRELTKPDDGSVRSGRAAKAERTGKMVDVFMPRRSLLIMRGTAREQWQHEIVRSRKEREGSNWRRLSLTFRTDKS
jgi:alkylated DNA repair dioxygenase AlkB